MSTHSREQLHDHHGLLHRRFGARPPSGLGGVRTDGCGRAVGPAPRHRPSPPGLGPGDADPGRRARGDSPRPARLRRFPRSAGRSSVHAGGGHPGSRGPLRGAGPRSPACGRQLPRGPVRPGAGAHGAGPLGDRPVARGFLERAGAPLRLHDPAGDAPRRAGPPGARDRAAVAQCGRTYGADQHDLRPARQAFTRGRRRRDPGPAGSDRLPPDAGRRRERLLHRRCEGHPRHRRLGHPRPHPAPEAGRPRQARDP